MPLGQIRALHNFGAGDVMEIETPAGATEFIPFNAAIVPTVEIPNAHRHRPAPTTRRA